MGGEEKPEEIDISQKERRTIEAFAPWGKKERGEEGDTC